MIMMRDRPRVADGETQNYVSHRAKLRPLCDRRGKRKSIWQNEILTTTGMRCARATNMKKMRLESWSIRSLRCFCRSIRLAIDGRTGSSGGQ